MLLVIYSKKDSGARHRFAGMPAVIKGKVLLQGMDGDSNEGQLTMKQFSIDRLPAFVLADASGKVVAKQEGPDGADAIAAKLVSLTSKLDRQPSGR